LGCHVALAEQTTFYMTPLMLKYISIGVARIDHAPLTQPLGQAAPGRTREGHPQQGIEKRAVGPAGRPLQDGSKEVIRSPCSSVKVWRVQVILAKLLHYIIDAVS
jgi:hypothetical protein